MNIELVLKAWQFLLDYHGLEAELEIIKREEGENESERAGAPDH